MNDRLLALDRDLHEALTWFADVVTADGGEPGQALRFLTRGLLALQADGYKRECENTVGRVDDLVSMPGWHISFEVLAMPYGSPEKRDRKGHYATPDTQFYEHRYPTVPVFYNHALFQKTPQELGEARFLRKDERGIWYDVSLNWELPTAATLWEAARLTALRASSGSAVYRRVADDGRLLVWPIIELSLLDIREGDLPTNWDAVVVPSAYYRPPEEIPEALRSGISAIVDSLATDL